MVDFNQSLSDPRAEGSGSTGRLAPVAPANNSASIAKLAGGLIDNFAVALGNYKKEKKEVVEDAIVGDYVRSVSAINNGIASGEIKPSQASTRLRALNNQYYAAHPNLIKRFGEANNILEQDTEVGLALEQEKATRDALNTEIGEMIKVGVNIFPGMPEEDIEVQRRTFRYNNQVKAQVEEQRKAQSHQIALNTEDRAATNFQQKQDAIVLLGQMGSKNGDAFLSYGKSVAVNALQTGNVDEAVFNIRAYASRLINEARQASLGNSELASGYVSLYEGISNSLIESITKKQSTEALSNNLSSFKNQLVLMAGQSNPEVARMIALSEITKGNYIGQMIDSTRIAQLISFTKDGKGNMVLGGDLDFPTTQTAKNAIRGFSKNTSNEKLAKETENIISTLLNSAAASEIYEASPADFKAFTDFVASDEFYQAIQQGLVDQTKIDRAMIATQRMFEQPVINSISDRLNSTFSFGSSSNERTPIPLADMVEVSYGVGGVVFKVKPDLPYMNQFTKQTFNEITKGLETSRKALNTLIRMGAHVDNSNDYRGYFEKNKHILLPGMFQAPTEDGSKQQKKTSSVETSYFDKLAQVESSGNPDAESPTSSAVGLYQFTESTWKKTVEDLGLDYSLGDRKDPEKSRVVMEEFTAQNRDILSRRLGREPSDTELYMAHFLGASGASKFLSAPPDANAKDYVSKSAANSNQPVFYNRDGSPRTVAEVLAMFKDKFEGVDG